MKKLQINNWSKFWRLMTILVFMYLSFIAGMVAAYKLI